MSGYSAKLCASASLRYTRQFFFFGLFARIVGMSRAEAGCDGVEYSKRSGCVSFQKSIRILALPGKQLSDES
jgi:hypothetical protein